MYIIYSIIITSIPKEAKIHWMECTEGSAFYTVQNKSPFSLLIPQNKLLNDMPEVSIRPNCSYKIQVYANPRARPIEKALEVIRKPYKTKTCMQMKNIAFLT